MNFVNSYANKRVLVTGHTGFKGSWLTEWLLLLGARVTGYSLPPPTEPALFSRLGLRERIVHFEADIREAAVLRRAILETEADFVFHLAAQSLVRKSYEQPQETFEVNVMGTVNVLEALRGLKKACVVVFITTDKCYEEKDSFHCYREEDPLGGHDPYSASKAAAEIAVSAYRRSFFARRDAEIAVASARAGNVLGGGDWAEHRLVPDCIRALACAKPIVVRNPSAIRPWQHVLDPLCGYLELGGALAEEHHHRTFAATSRQDESDCLASAFNFGPGATRHSVRELVEEILKHWPGTWHNESQPDAPHEMSHLSLATDKAARLLGWSPTWDFPEAVRNTVAWYRQSQAFAASDSTGIGGITRQQIIKYMAEHERRKLSAGHPNADGISRGHVDSLPSALPSAR